MELTNLTSCGMLEDKQTGKILQLVSEYMYFICCDSITDIKSVVGRFHEPE